MSNSNYIKKKKCYNILGFKGAPQTRREYCGNLVPGNAKMFLNLFRNILLPQQMFPRLRAEETFRETMFPQQCFFVCGRLKGTMVWSVMTTWSYKNNERSIHVEFEDKKYTSKSKSHALKTN